MPFFYTWFNVITDMAHKPHNHEKVRPISKAEVAPEVLKKAQFTA